MSHAAVILGIVPDFGKGSMLTLNNILEERMQAQMIQKRKEGPAQSSPAWYKAKYNIPDPG